MISCMYEKIAALYLKTTPLISTYLCVFTRKKYVVLEKLRRNHDFPGDRDVTLTLTLVNSVTLCWSYLVTKQF